MIIYISPLVDNTNITKLVIPKEKVILINDKEYVTLNLYNFSKYFKVLIDSYSHQNTEIDNKIEHFLNYVIFNIQLKLEIDQLIEFTIFCDYIQMTPEIFYKIYEYAPNADNHEEIINLVFKNVDDEKKIEIYKKYNFVSKIMTPKDLDLCMKDFSNLTINKVYQRQDLSYEDKSKVLLNYINTIKDPQYELCYYNDEICLKTEMYDKYVGKIIIGYVLHETNRSSTFYPQHITNIKLIKKMESLTKEEYINYIEMFFSNKKTEKIEEKKYETNENANYFIGSVFSFAKVRNCFMNTNLVSITTVAEIIKIIQECIERQNIKIIE